MELKPHNQKAYDNLMQMYKSGTKSAAIVHPTGTGKTYITMQLVKDHPNENVVVVAPTNAIIDQYKKRFEENGIDDSNVTYLTYSKVMNMNEEDLGELHAGKIVLDEFHHCGAQEWGQGISRLIEKNKEANILGLSATPIRYLDNLRDMTKELFEGNVASEITLPEAILDGLLEIPDYHQGLYSIQNEDAKLRERIARLPEEELREELSRRLGETSGTLSKMESTKQILERAITGDKKTGRYIVFCRDIKDMHNAMKHAEEWFADINDVEMYSVATKDALGKTIEHSKNREKIEAFEHSKSGKIKLMFAVNMLNEGIHVKGVDGVIMLRGTKSPIIYRQQIGRVLSIGGKENPQVFDFADNISCTKYVYELYEEMREIIKKRKNDGKDITREEEIISKFKIDDHVKSMRELEKELDDLTYMDSSLIEETLKTAQILHKNGVDLKHMKYIKNAKRLKLNELEQDGVDFDKIIRENNLNPYFKMGLGVTVARLSYNDKAYFELTPEQREIAVRTGIVKTELDYNKIQKLFYVCQVLKERGVDISRLPTQKNNKKLLLKNIEQYGIDIQDIIKESGLEPHYPIGTEITNFRMMYDKLTKEEKRIGKELGLLREDKNKMMLLDTLRIATILKQNGVKFEELQTNKRTLLGACEQQGIDFKKILEENGLDPSFEFGKGRAMLVKAYQGSKYEALLTDAQKAQIKDLGLASPPKKEEPIEIALKLLEKLKSAGVDVLKIPSRRRENGTSRYNLLCDIKLEGVDLDSIIAQLNLDPNEKIGTHIATIKETYAGRRGGMTLEQQKRAEKLLNLGQITPIQEFFQIAEILKKNGVIIHKLQRGTLDETGKRKYFTLQELTQKGINFEKIIRENNLSGTYNFGFMHNSVASKYNSKTVLTEEERKKVEELGIVNTDRITPMANLISILTILKQEGVDLTDINLSRKNSYILLKDIVQEGIDIGEIIKKHGLDGEYSLGIAIGRLRGACKGVGSDKVTEKEKEKAKELGILIDEKDLTDEAFEIIGILIKAGFSFKKTALTKDGKTILLKDLKQNGLNLSKVIKENGLSKNYPIGQRIVKIRMGYNNVEGIKPLTEEQRKLAEESGILSSEWRNDKALRYFFKVIKTLKDAGADISQIQWGTKKSKFVLGELKIPGVDVAEIIKKEGLDPEYKIGSSAISYRGRYNKGTLSEEEKLEGEELGVFSKPKEMSAVSEVIHVSKILIANGVDVRKLRISQTENGKQRKLKLGELTYEGVDIGKIIADNGLDPKYGFGQRIQYAVNAVAGHKGYVITEDEKREVLELGILDRRKALLQERLKTAQELDEKVKQAKQLETEFENLAGTKKKEEE